MEHWFDRLAEPHTRRTTLKAGAVGAAALMLPFGRVTSAAAKQSEPCFKPCVEIATTAWDKHADHVSSRAGLAILRSSITSPPVARSPAWSSPCWSAPRG